jgi:hypothetical protein
MTDQAVTVLLAPRINTTGFLAVVYRNAHGEIVTMGVANLQTAIPAITACLQYQFDMEAKEAAELAQEAVDRYASGILAIEEADALSVTLRDQLLAAERLVKSLSSELVVARATQANTQTSSNE